MLILYIIGGGVWGRGGMEVLVPPPFFHTKKYRYNLTQWNNSITKEKKIREKWLITYMDFIFKQVNFSHQPPSLKREKFWIRACTLTNLRRVFSWNNSFLALFYISSHSQIWSLYKGLFSLTPGVSRLWYISTVQYSFNYYKCSCIRREPTLDCINEAFGRFTQ